MEKLEFPRKAAIKALREVAAKQKTTGTGTEITEVPADATFIVGGIDPRLAIPGSRRIACRRCTHPTWFAPSGQKQIDNGTVIPLCPLCALFLLERDKDGKAGYLKDALVELNRGLK